MSRIDLKLKANEIVRKNEFEHCDDVTVAEKSKIDASLANIASNTPSTPRNSFSKELAFWSGYHYPTPFWQTLLGPLKMVRSPIVLWTSLVFMTAITWIVIITIGASQIFAAPPYNFSVAAVGNIFVAPFVASAVGTVVAKPLIDGGAKYLARRNRGIFGKALPPHQAFFLFKADEANPKNPSSVCP